MLSRRQFVTSALAAGVVPASQKANAQPTKRIIVDAQVHVWPAETPQRPWQRPGDAHLPKPFGYEDLRIEMARAGVDRAILIPPGWEGDRIDFVLAAAAKYPDRFAAMGRIPLQDPRSIALLPERGRDLAHEARHIVLDLRVRLHPHVEVEDHFGEACRLDLFQRLGDARC